MRALVLFALVAVAAYLAGVETYHTHRSLQQEALASDYDVEDAANLFKIMADLVPTGFSLQEHFVTTGDGYILRLFRLQPACSTPRPAIYLQHALLDSSAGWLLMGEKSLAPMLATAGFDVWLGNVRGNRFSRNHTALDPDRDGRFWGFSWDEMAAYDLPATVVKILNVTGQPSLQYVGYSQGTTMALAALSSLHQQSQPAAAGAAGSGAGAAGAISHAVLLAPVAFVGHITSAPFRAMSVLPAAQLLRAAGVLEFGAAVRDHHAPAWSTVCGWWPALCRRWLELLCGSNPTGNLDPGLVARLVRHMPAGTSTQNMAKWGQGVRAPGSGPLGLRHMDFGTSCTHPRTGAPRQCNQRRYNGSSTPPPYNLSRITTHLSVFTGGRDTLSDPDDVALLLQALPPSIVVHHHHEPNYAHLDFGLGADAHRRLYPRVIRQLLVGAAAAEAAAPQGRAHLKQQQQQAAAW